MPSDHPRSCELCPQIGPPQVEKPSTALIHIVAYVVYVELILQYFTVCVSVAQFP